MVKNMFFFLEMNRPSLSFILIAIFMPWIHLRVEWKGRSKAKQTKSTHVAKMRSQQCTAYLEQLRKKDCPNSWSARLSQSQDVDGQGLGYTSRHSGCNTTIQQFLCCILRRALTSLVLSYKNCPLWLSTKIFSTGLCAANHRWRLVLLSSSEWRYQNFDRNRYWDFYSDTKFSKTENLKKIGKSFETEMSISVVKFSASAVVVGWGGAENRVLRLK